MKTLVAKEIRQMLPAFGMALLLVIVPFWLLPTSTPNGEYSANLTFPLLCFGTLMMALTSFGREFGMGTFPLLLALPLDRKRIWWTKMTVLGTGVALVFGVYLLSLLPAFYLPATKTLWFGDIGTPAGLAITFIVIIASGLWTTLLLRQIVAAFWFAVLIPAAILTLILWNGGRLLTAQIVLVLYAIAGFWWARHQFYRAQEVAWTGGEVNLPAWQSDRAGVRSAGRSYRPLAALFWKELQLYQVALLGMAGLFVLHLGVIALRKSLRGDNENGVLYTALTFFGGLWLIVPLITGSLNVADERRLGTLEAHLCLPVSRRKQFAIKLLVMLVLSGFLCAFLLWLAEAIGDAFHVGAGLGGIKISAGEGLATLSAMFLGLSIIVFFASTLCRSILQAVVTAVVLVFIFFILWACAENIRWLTGTWPWQEPLLSIITVPTMVVTILWLAYGNFRRLAETRRLWLRNAGGLIGAIVFAAALATLLFQRAWEWLTPLEPPHGAARLSLSQAPKFHADYYSVSAVLPDGRLWWDRIAHDPGLTISFFQDANYSIAGGKWVGASGGHYPSGSNWVAVADTYKNSVGIRSDGTLWHSEDDKPVIWYGPHPLPQPISGMSRAGEAADWKQVVRRDGYNFALLKTDGTLWRWGTNRNFSGALATQELKQIGTESDWSELFNAQAGSFAWKKDGQAWKIAWPAKNREKIQTVLEPELALERWPDFDKIKWRSLAGWAPFQLGVREDGTLWSFGGPNINYITDGEGLKQPKQFGMDRDWVAVTGDNRMMIALKTDGTLWKWDMKNWWWNYRDWPFSKPPTRLGTHSDWVAISGSNGGLWSLAADGSIWYWSLPQGDGVWLAPSRKPVKFANLFSQQ